MFFQGDYLMTVKERDDAIKKLQEEEERKVGTCSALCCLGFCAFFCDTAYQLPLPLENIRELFV